MVREVGMSVYVCVCTYDIIILCKGKQKNELSTLLLLGGGGLGEREGGRGAARWFTEAAAVVH